MQMSTVQKRFVIAGIMLSVFMASMEATVVATAMPTIAAQLGGLERYSWVFAAYLLTSTTTVPIYGKLSDLYGRRRVYAVAMVLFLAGSLLCGMATSMTQLVWFRALQGIGAGGVLPLAFIMIGEMFSFEQRARFQGLFSGVWGVSSVVGPLLGGFIVDQLSWPWIFYVNLGPGLLAMAFVWFAWQDAARPAGAGRPAVDAVGAVLLTLTVIALMVGLQSTLATERIGLLAAAALLFVVLLWWERRAADPILPMHLFRQRLFAASVANGTLAGMAMFGSINFVPLFVQTVLGTSATAAGITMTPMLMSWVIASIIGSRLLLRVDYRTLALAGMVLLSLGALVMTFVDQETRRRTVMAALALMGTGMGLSVPAFLIAVQSTVQRSSLGTATSTLQFSRSIGGTLGTAVMGAVLSARLLAGIKAGGEAVDAASLNQLLAGTENAGGQVVISETVRTALSSGISGVFWIALAAALLGLAATALAPRGTIHRLSTPSHAPVAVEVEPTSKA